MIAKRAVEILHKSGILPRELLPRLKDYERHATGNVLDFCLAQKRATSAKLIELLAANALPAVNLDETDIDLTVARLVPREHCIEYAVIPFAFENDQLFVAMADPDNARLVASVARATGKRVVPYLAQHEAIARAIEAAFDASAEDASSRIREIAKRAAASAQNPTTSDETPIIEFLDRLITFAALSRASDLHIEPTADDVVFRFRIDGLLQELCRAPRSLHAPLIARIKILAHLRIDEHLRPQDGRFAVMEQGRPLAIRVSVVPTLYGQKAALRFLDEGSANLSLASIGLSESDGARLRHTLAGTSGLILVTGPTGSGKTTTLYSMLNALPRDHLNVSTIEDPIEYHLNGVTQMQANPQVGLTFSEGLRAILRQDPDIIMVGEIRDRETAQIAINAALTGHLVLSSLHTKSAAAAIPRLMDMGLEPYLLASTLRAVVGQRLVRTVCASCRTASPAADLPDALQSVLRDRASGPVTPARGLGCGACLGTGFRGRSGIFEILEVGVFLHDAIMARANAASIEALAQRNGMRPLLADGADKVLAQRTTPEEILRVIS